MFVFLSKFLPQFIYPLGLAVLLLFFISLLRLKPRVQKSIILFILILLFIGGNRWVAMSLARSLEWQYLPSSALPSAKAIVVLGGGTEPQQFPRQTVESNGASDRVFYAAYLYKQGKAPVILLSGGSIQWLDSRGASTPAQEMAEFLRWLNIPESSLWLETESRNTRENALYSQEMLQAQGIDTVILVTSAFHMPRSVLLFQKVGIHVIPAPTDYTITQVEWDELMRPDLTTLLVNLMPTPSNLSLTTNALKEYLGMLVYRMRGWI
jgi:uncharacterized SAM-binding protein YcdF (DUF218 family)